MALLERWRGVHRGLPVRPPRQRVRGRGAVRAQDEERLQPAAHRPLRLRHNVHHLQHRGVSNHAGAGIR